MIDLAGSEKASSSAERRKEGAYINKSLLTLGTVISKLSEGTTGHIPFRDSKLTRILQTSLSGNARVSVICTINPALANVEESHNTLKFATRLKKITTKAKANQVMDDKALLQRYKTEITELKSKLLRINSDVNQEEVEMLKREKAKYEEDRMEMELVRTALKERIDHLTKLILTSSTIASKPILDWSETGSRRTLELDSPAPQRRSAQSEKPPTTAVAHLLAEKDALIVQLRQQLEAKLNISIAESKTLAESTGTASSFSSLRDGGNGLSGESPVTSPTDDDKDLSTLRFELQQTRRLNIDLRIRTQEQEAKNRSLRSQLESERLLRFNKSSPTGVESETQRLTRECDAMAGTLEEQRIVIYELEMENSELRGLVADLRQSLTKLETADFKQIEGSLARS